MFTVKFETDVNGKKKSVTSKVYAQKTEDSQLSFLVANEEGVFSWVCWISCTLVIKK